LTVNRINGDANIFPGFQVKLLITLIFFTSIFTPKVSTNSFSYPALPHASWIPQRGNRLFENFIFEFVIENKIQNDYY